MNKTNQPAQPEQVEDRRGRAGEVAKKAAAAVAGAGALAGMGGATAALANDLNGSQELVDNLAVCVCEVAEFPLADCLFCERGLGGDFGSRCRC